MRINKGLFQKNKAGIYELNQDIIIPKGDVLLLLQDVNTGELIEDYYKNLVTTAGKVSMAAALRGDTSSNKGIITYCAVGTGTNAPALADTDLQTELDRKLVGVRSNSSNAAIFQTFFNTSEANGTLREAGLFGDDATDTADSGTMFTRTAINRTKNSSQTLLIYWSITIG